MVFEKLTYTGCKAFARTELSKAAALTVVVVLWVVLVVDVVVDVVVLVVVTESMLSMNVIPTIL